ncbi:MAG: ribbon-helix-helix domain-containing protein [Pseudomonadales bacterium]
MRSSKIAITLNTEVLSEIDMLVKKHMFPSRSRAIQEAVMEKLARLNHNQLAQECSKLNPEFEQSLAEEGLKEDLSEWPKY